MADVGWIKLVKSHPQTGAGQGLLNTQPITAPPSHDYFLEVRNTCRTAEKCSCNFRRRAVEPSSSSSNLLRHRGGAGGGRTGEAQLPVVPPRGLCNTGLCRKLTRQQIDWLLRDAAPHDGSSSGQLLAKSSQNREHTNSSVHIKAYRQSTAIFRRCVLTICFMASGRSSLTVRKCQRKPIMPFIPWTSRNALAVRCIVDLVHPFNPLSGRGSEGCPLPTPVIGIIRIVSRGWINSELEKVSDEAPPGADICMCACTVEANKQLPKTHGEPFPKNAIKTCFLQNLVS